LNVAKKLVTKLAAVVENDDARADEFCATENPTGFDIFDNNREA